MLSLSPAIVSPPGSAAPAGMLSLPASALTLTDPLTQLLLHIRQDIIAQLPVPEERKQILWQYAEGLLSREK